MSILNRLSTHKSCSLMWVPGHSGILGSEEADLQANASAAQDLIGPEPALPMSMSVIKSHMKVWVKDYIDISWRASTTCKTTKACFPVFDFQKSLEIRIEIYHV